MERNSEENRNRNGLLPSSAPLANAYVPFQPEKSIRYDARKALVRGTLYPGLDLPFMGMYNIKEQPVTPLSELQVLGFAIQELALYLDTHSDDKEALQVYRDYQKTYSHCVTEYQKRYGPMNHLQENDRSQYEWIHDPWPWEYCKNKEV